VRGLSGVKAAGLHGDVKQITAVRFRNENDRDGSSVPQFKHNTGAVSRNRIFQMQSDAFSMIADLGHRMAEGCRPVFLYVQVAEDQVHISPGQPAADRFSFGKK
jgi:hypothetical protein